jgi:hypothetical protein
MPRGHLRTYRRPKPADDATAELERILAAEQVPDDAGPIRERRSIDYRPLVVGIGLVISGLAAIAFVLTLRASG